MRSLIVLVAFAAMLPVCAAKDEFQAGDFVNQHLNSIGPEPARAAVKNRGVGGTVSFQILTGGSGREDGKQILVSEGDKLVSLLQLPNHRYPGERFVSDGKKAFIAETQASVYSAVGEFFMAHSEILTEGLWGGTLSTAWALARLDKRLAKLEDHGLKKVDGRELHRVDYLPKKPSDLQIELYFEPDTFRHVMTVYSFTTDPSMTHNRTENERQSVLHSRLEERFADFKSIDNLALPSRWTIQFSSDRPGGLTGFSGNRNAPLSNAQASPTQIYQFDVTETSLSHNISIDPKNFELK
ncbi:MAG: hypothetical protein ACLPHP_04460 [Candidatus Sulfotelmatobacter sp.]